VFRRSSCDEKLKATSINKYRDCAIKTWCRRIVLIGNALKPELMGYLLKDATDDELITAGRRSARRKQVHKRTYLL